MRVRQTVLGVAVSWLQKKESQIVKEVGIGEELLDRQCAVLLSVRWETANGKRVNKGIVSESGQEPGRLVLNVFFLQR